MRTIASRWTRHWSLTSSCNRNQQVKDQLHSQEAHENASRWAQWLVPKATVSLTSTGCLITCKGMIPILRCYFPRLILIKILRSKRPREFWLRKSFTTPSLCIDHQKHAKRRSCSLHQSICLIGRIVPAKSQLKLRVCDLIGKTLHQVVLQSIQR